MNTITIHQTQMPIVEYRGQRVVTFAIIDQVHERPEGTAKRNFSDNRDRFRAGEDYFLIPKSESDGFRTFGIEVPNRGLTVLTEQGYLMVVKSLTDDLAWTVQRQLVNSYFRPQQFTVPQTRAEAIMPGETVPQFAKRLNGVNSQQMLAYLIEIKWVFNAERDPDSSPKYRVYAIPRDKHWLTEKPITIRGEGIVPFIKYTPVMLEEGARRLHDMYLAEKLPMKQTWDGKFTVSKFTSESPL